MYNSGEIESKPPLKIDLEEFAHVGLPLMTTAMCAVMAECASVCLQKNQHCGETKFILLGDHKKLFLIYPLNVDEIMQKTHNDLEVAAEYGACGIALQLVEQLTPHTFVERSRKKTGFDYWLCDKDDDLLQRSARLEVSGQHVENETDFKRRIKEKKQQSAPSDDTCLPAYAVVVNFSQPKAHMEVRRINKDEPSESH